MLPLERGYFSSYDHQVMPNFLKICETDHWFDLEIDTGKQICNVNCPLLILT